MLTDAVRRRIEVLNRQSLGTPEKKVARRPIRDVKNIDDTTHIARPGSGWLSIAQRVCNAAGEHLRIQTPLEQLWRAAPEHLRIAQRQKDQVLRRTRQRRYPELAAFLQSFPSGALFLDLETCGFAGSPIFLIGLLRQVSGIWQVDLLLARSYAEERAILATLWQVAAEHQVLVTFNGKSFDWPMVHDRSTLHHLGCPRQKRTDPKRTDQTRPTPSNRPNMPANNGFPNDQHEPDGTPSETRNLGRDDPRPELIHFDLLHHARRHWKRQLPNCRLQTLEWYICGRRRDGDIPGSQIPATYHHYVRTGQTRDMESVLHHNVVDLITLLELSLRISLGKRN